jgi:hypothetical protein
LFASLVHLLPKRKQPYGEVLQLIRASHQSIRELLNAFGLRSARPYYPSFERSAAQFRVTREQGTRKLALLDYFPNDLLDSLRAGHTRLPLMRRAG